MSSTATIIVAPDRLTKVSGKSVFLAGSIDMGAAIDWQATAIDAFSKLSVTVFSPRRKDWDSSWIQDINFAPFREQVEWELDMLDNATVIMLFFAGGSLSPISLLELGLYAKSGRLVVGCPPDFYRRGNVEIVCKRLNVPIYNTFEELLQETERLLIKE